MIGEDEVRRAGASPSALFILTGAPGSGKTAVLNRLRDQFACVDEPAREILAEQRSTGGRGTWDQDPSLFVHLLLQRSIDNYETARRLGSPVVFDRGIPDCIVYAERAGVDSRPGLEAAATYRYHPHVLFIEPWEEIYETDEERVMTFEATVPFSESLKEAYGRAGYVFDIVQRGSISDRAASVRAAVEQHLSTI